MGRGLVVPNKIKKIINQEARRADIEVGQAEEIWLSIGRFIASVCKEGEVLDNPIL